MLRSGLSAEDARKRIHDLVTALFRNIPSGVGSKRKDLRLTPKELSRVLQKGVHWAVENGYASSEDVAHTEAEGSIPGADPDRVS